MPASRLVQVVGQASGTCAERLEAFPKTLQGSARGTSSLHVGIASLRQPLDDQGGDGEVSTTCKPLTWRAESW